MNVVELRPERVVPLSAERYVACRELQRRMGVSRATIYRWVAQGMPSVTWGIRSRRFLPSQCIAWRQARKEQTA